jgi:hypothetical protein
VYHLRLNRFDGKDFTMSPTYFAIRMARLDEQLEIFRIAGDLPNMQKVLAQKTLLHRAMYGPVA